MASNKMISLFYIQTLIDSKQITDNSDSNITELVLKHNGHTAKMWKQRVWPKYKPMLWYLKRSGNGNSQGPTIYSDIEDLIESQPVDKTMHDWEQSTIEAEHIIKPLTVEGQIVRAMGPIE